MKKKDTLVLKYKILVPKAKKYGEEPDWEAMKISKSELAKKYDLEPQWIKRTFSKSGIISIEDIDEGSVINHKDGTFVVTKRFKKLLKIIYK